MLPMTHRHMYRFYQNRQVGRITVRVGRVGLGLVGSGLKFHVCARRSIEAMLTVRYPTAILLVAQPASAMTRATRGCSSAGEHLLCTQGARGSIPLTSTSSDHSLS